MDPCICVFKFCSSDYYRVTPNSHAMDQVPLLRQSQRAPEAKVRRRVTSQRRNGAHHSKPAEPPAFLLSKHPGPARNPYEVMCVLHETKYNSDGNGIQNISFNNFVSNFNPPFSLKE